MKKLYLKTNKKTLIAFLSFEEFSKMNFSKQIFHIYHQGIKLCGFSSDQSQGIDSFKVQ